MNRKARRQNERQKTRRKRKLDWNKIANEFISILKIIVVFVLILAGIIYYVVNSNNKLKNKISENSEKASGIVVNIHSGKFSFADYEFVVNNKTYSGSTSSRYHSDSNRYICIEYYKEDPNLNIHCGDSKVDSIYENVVLFSLKIFGIMLLFNIALILWKIINKDKKILSEIMS